MTQQNLLPPPHLMCFISSSIQCTGRLDISVLMLLTVKSLHSTTKAKFKKSVTCATDNKTTMYVNGGDRSIFNNNEYQIM